MEIKISALMVKLDLQQNGLAKTFQQNNPEPLPPLQAPTPQPLHEFRSPRPTGHPQVSLHLCADREAGWELPRGWVDLYWFSSPPFPDPTRLFSLGFSWLLRIVNATANWLWFNNRTNFGSRINKRVERAGLRAPRTKGGF